jgi:hypothetical protein
MLSVSRLIRVEVDAQGSRVGSDVVLLLVRKLDEGRVSEMCVEFSGEQLEASVLCDPPTHFSDCRMKVWN